MPKEMPEAVYVYYGCTDELPDWAREYLEKAREILRGRLCNVLGEYISCLEIPFNIIKVSKDGKVTFSWYSGFWDELKPRLIYYITVDTKTGEVRETPYSKVRRHPVYPLDVLHGKEFFVEGLEKKVVNPYGNWMSLGWDSKLKKDVWKPLFYGDKKRIRRLKERLRTLLEEFEKKYPV